VICAQRDARTVLQLDADDPRDLAAALRERWAPAARRVVITRGAYGAVAVDAAGTRHVQLAVPGTIVDRFGMGDAFAAGLLWGLLTTDGEDLGGALHAAVTLAALKGTVHGDLSRTSLPELTAALRSDHEEIVR
jgi:sugar/nucleoside kinase (ribokinase family)